MARKKHRMGYSWYLYYLSLDYLSTDYMVKKKGKRLKKKKKNVTSPSPSTSKLFRVSSSKLNFTSSSEAFLPSSSWQ